MTEEEYAVIGRAVASAWDAAEREYFRYNREIDMEVRLIRDGMVIRAFTTSTGSRPQLNLQKHLAWQEITNAHRPAIPFHIASICERLYREAGKPPIRVPKPCAGPQITEQHVMEMTERPNQGSTE